MRKLAPYQMMGYLGSAIVVLYVLLVLNLQIVAPRDWLYGFAVGNAGAVLLATAIELGLLVKDYRAGYLFPMRNATFFVVAASLTVFPLFAIYTYATGGSFQASTLLLIPVFLFFAVRNLFRVRVDNVSLTAKTGFGAPLNVPLFGITGVTAEERKIRISVEDGRQITLLRSFFFTGHWERLKEKLVSLA